MFLRFIVLIWLGLPAYGCLASAASGADSTRSLAVVPLVSEQQLVLTPATLGVVVNLNDPDSVKLGSSYVKARGIPGANVIGLHLPRVNFVAGHIFRRELLVLKSNPKYESFVGLALAFDKPYRVDANQSITTAFSQGLADLVWKGVCIPTIDSPDKGRLPGEPLSLKPAFLLNGGAGLQSSIELIERGIASDGSDPAATILMATTSDQARSMPRKASMERSFARFKEFVTLNDFPDQMVKSEAPLIGLQTGVAVMGTLRSLTFLPGAYADLLTSSGGALNDNKGQTTAAQIIASGATASFGTVREPCNFAAKFPDPERMAQNYLGGDSLLEAYWKSVDWVTEGLFLGEPLARPFPVFDAYPKKQGVELRVNRQTFLTIGSNLSPNMVRRCTHSLPDDGVEVGVFTVETGHPVFVQDVCVAETSKPGDIVAELEVKNRVERLMLGVLVRK